MVAAARVFLATGVAVVSGTVSRPPAWWGPSGAAQTLETIGGACRAPRLVAVCACRQCGRIARNEHGPEADQSGDPGV
jgi:hypothetical protein